ncbi:telomerase protein component 1 [Spea bombifrons]|uniref:telomerase protein component 1 n=1 Tax=Spea bombifrons TaxID=233779 RepID=UPI00234A67C2|nr:telomerase protein component 1 [Spea bombifrons]
MPIHDTCSSGSSRLSLENSVLRGGKLLSQPRCRLALNLPGTDWPSIGPVSEPRVNHPQTLSLGPSWEEESKKSGISKLTSQPLLASKYAQTSNLILNSQLVVNSPSTEVCDLSSPLMTSTSTTPNSLILNLSNSALASNLSLHSKLEVASNASLFSKPLVNCNSSLASEFVTPHDTVLSNHVLKTQSTFFSSSKCKDSIDPSKMSLQTPHPVDVPSNLNSTLVASPGKWKDLVPQDSLASPEIESSSLSAALLPEEEILYRDTAPVPSEANLEITPPKDVQSVFIVPAAKETLQTLKQRPDALKIEKPNTVRQKKMALLSAVCCSLVNGPNFSDKSDLTRVNIQSLCEEISRLDPEFVLKVALYTRQELNIRSTANFLLAVAASLPACRPHLGRYFWASIQLPSDWMEVPRLYQSLVGKDEKLVPLPSCLRRAMTMKFKEFGEYQLAKYNTRRQRGKHGPKKQSAKKNLTVSRPIKLGKSLAFLTSSLKGLIEKFNTPQSTTCKKQKKEKDRFSLKSLIQRLHISKPANHVMSLLGCKYPKDIQSFSRSGLEGPWQSQLAGCRMKLKQPETWERELSQKGNTGPVWEKLLDNKQVPFMALLRNLRNLIRAGVSERHHKEVTKRLSSQNSVIRSRLFPFRFLSAYKVIQELESQQLKCEKPFPSNMELFQRIIRREGKSFPQLQRHKWTPCHLRACLAVPALYLMLKSEKEALKKARASQPDKGILQKYKRALEEAVQISARYNIPPLPGRTVILLCVDPLMYQPCHGAKELCLSMEEPTLGQRNATPTLMEVGMLLSLMVKTTSESTELVLCNEYSFALADATPDQLLQNLVTLKQQAEDLPSSSDVAFEQKDPMVQYMQEILMKRTMVDTLLLFTSSPPGGEFRSVLQHYRREVNADCLCVTVLPNGFNSEDKPDQCNDVTLCGFTEQVLRYVSERGTARLIDHVENVNKRFNVPEDPDSVRKSHAAPRGIIVPAPTQRWRSIRIFISSTFRDMHGERDVIIGRVIPELRVRASRHFLSIEEVDLRWGITEEEAKQDRQLYLCLSEVSRSQIFIGILGERYGHIPETYSVPLLPEYKWVQTYPPGRSITELEAMQFLQNCDPSSRSPKAFFYLRDPEVIRSVPSRWLSDFAAESQYAEMRMRDLKSRVTKEPTARSYRYSCQWGSERDGKPSMAGLEDFEAQLLGDIWHVIERDYIREESDIVDDDEEQEGFQEWQESVSCARKKLVVSTCAHILSKSKSSPANGRMLLVCGQPSQGKTVFMAALVKELRLAPSSLVIYHFTGATPEAREAESMLTRLCKQLSLHLQKESCNITSYRALRDEFHSLLLLTSRSLGRSGTLTLLIDGADLLCGNAGELTSDWIPEHLPRHVNLILSMTEGSSLCCSLARRKDSVLMSLGTLEPSDRAELVRQRLAVYGKKLDESSFNNQMRLLLIKKGSRDPLYLTLASEELRANAIFEKLSDDIQKIPATIGPLIQRRLTSLEEEHGQTFVTIALTAICLSQKGLEERDLLRILSTLKSLNSVYTASWNQMLSAATHAKNLPMATFSFLLRGLKSVLGLWNVDTRLYLPKCLLRDAVEKRYFIRPDVAQAVHLLMAAHFWTVCFPEDPESNPLPPAECVSELSHHLLCSQQLHTMGHLLAHLPFLRTHATLGLLPHLCQVYSRYDKAVSEKTSSGQGRKKLSEQPPEPFVREFREFIQRSLPILSRTPSLFYQLALNEPDCSPVCAQAQAIVDARICEDTQLVMKRSNKPGFVNVCSSKSIEVPSSPGCAALSSEGRLAAVGTSDGNVHLVDTDSGKEVRILHSGCDGVSAGAFITADILCVSSYDGTLEIWNIRDGCRMHRTEAHRRMVTGCCVSADHRQLLTCSLDSQLKLWETSRGSLLSVTSFPSPLNCVAFHPRRNVAVVGSWDGNSTVLKLDSWKREAILGSGSSVRAVSFSLEGNMVISGSLDGWVSLWAWEACVQLAHFRAHSGATLTTSYLPQGEQLLTGGEDGKVQVWSGGLGRMAGQIQTESTQSPALCLAISPNKKLLAVGYHSGSVSIYNADSGDLVSQCIFPDVAVGAVIWLSDSKLVTGSSDSYVRVWNISPDESHCKFSLRGHKRAVRALSVSSRLLASASEDVSVCLWLLEDLLNAVSPPAPVSVLRGHSAPVTCCSFSKDGQFLATGGQDRSVLCWDVTLNPPVTVHALLSCHKDWVSDCAWTEDTKLISCSGDGSVCLWDITQQQCLLQFAGHQSAVSSAICVGKHVLSSSRDGCLKVWNLEGVEICSIPTHRGQIYQSIAYLETEESRDDAELVVYTAGSDGSVLRWNPLQMDKVQTLYGHGHAVISSLASPRCNAIVTAALDGSVRIWGMPCRDEHPLPYRHVGAVTAVAWSPDAELVVSGGENGDLAVWRNQKVVLSVQCSKLCISSVVFTAPRSFCVVSSDNKVSSWLLLSSKGDGLRLKKVYSVEMDSLVVAAHITTSNRVQLHTVSGKIYLLEPKTGLLQYDLRSVLDTSFQPPPEQLEPGTIVTVSIPDFGICDSAGGLWLHTTGINGSKDKADNWKRIQIHHASVSSLLATDGYVVSASADRTVKVWEYDPFRQVGVFHCEGGVTSLSLAPKLQSQMAKELCQIACGDQYGNVYILTCI